MPIRSATTRRLRFQVDVFDEWTAARGIVTKTDKAKFLGLEPSTYSRVSEGVNWPGETFIAAVVNAFAAHPDITFSQLFEVVEVTK